MATRAVLLSGIAAFGLGLLTTGALFDAPGGEAPQPSPAAQAAPSELRWDPLLTAEPSLAPEPRPAPEAEPPTTDVWATPAEWSVEE